MVIGDPKVWIRRLDLSNLMDRGEAVNLFPASFVKSHVAQGLLFA